MAAVERSDEIDGRTDGAATVASESEYAQPEISYSVDEAIDSMGMGRFNAAMLCMGGVAWMADAAEVMLISFIKPAVQCSWGVSDFEGSLISSAVGLGSLIGAIAWGVLSDRRGRRLGFLLTGVFVFVFGLLSAAAPSYGWLVLFRFLCGVGLGGVPVVFSLAMEFLPSDQRGRWGIGFLLFWSVGGMLEAALAWRIMLAYGWRWQVGLTSIPAGLMLLVYPILPESPRWLLAQGRREEAQAVLLRWARANGVRLVGSLRADEADAAKHSLDGVDHEHGSGEIALGGLRELLMPGVRRLTLLLWYVWFVGGGIYYGIILVQPDIIGAEHSGERCPEYNLAPLPSSAAGAEEARDAAAAVSSPSARSGKDYCAQQLTSDDYAATFIAASGELPGILLMVAVIDRIGRRATMGWGAAICAAVCVLLIPCTSYGTETALIWLGRGKACLLRHLY
jgi:MFS family permease